MKRFKLNVLASTTLAALCAAASASPIATFMPSALPGSSELSFQADFIAGTTSELITETSSTTLSGSGWVQLNAFTNGGNHVFNTGLDATYQLYLKFSFADTLASGTMLGSGSTYNLTNLNFQVYADPGLDTTFTQANAATNTGATVNGTTGDDILLGEAAYGGAVNGVAGFDSGGGAYLNAQEGFALCTGNGTAAVGAVAVAAPDCKDSTGRQFFSQPSSFYDMTSSEFNNTAQGVIVNGDAVSITNATGGIDFSASAVPEPTPLALFGAALSALVFIGRRKRQG